MLLLGKTPKKPLGPPTHGMGGRVGVQTPPLSTKAGIWPLTFALVIALPTL